MSPAPLLGLTPTALDRYRLADLAADLFGDDPERGLRAARETALRINAARRDSERPPVSGGLVRALVVLTRSSAALIARYVRDVDPEFRLRLTAVLTTVLTTANDTLAGSGPGARPGPPAPIDGTRAVSLLLLALLDRNPALAPVRDLMIDEPTDEAPLDRTWSTLDTWLTTRPGFGDDAPTLAELLTLPLREAPDDAAAQLRLAHAAWSPVLGSEADVLLLAAGELSEEARPRFDGPGPVEALCFEDRPADTSPASGHDEDTEAYSPDSDWMPRLVLLAKNTHVWLSQLSRRHGREIATLDAVPDSELDEIAGRGITGLWLIGVWQRSRASREIKRRRGNPEALASAYAIDAYRVADDLGGENALADLSRRAAERGLRLAGDMVPNHTGIDSEWVHDHPERFVSETRPPFPAYGFDGDDLCDRPDLDIRLENGYADHSDAAVVFQRTDPGSGRTLYIYHGNDGTNMPWNDTAQIDFVNPETREAVIREIIAVARRFPVIRFDAAMVLARRHVRRLWHPEPGAGSDIPGRAAHAMTQVEFDRAMPLEFWREVVDRIAVEAPDTLLLAEAFWLMEGYFVRTLGMHRVYNSAFMHMIRDRDNALYRKSIRNVLEYAPAILQRMVNFLSNPDEATAESQFGKGDRYFGACTLLATLPGLPLFAHGQIEGFTEKYGMEYARDYAGEDPDLGFVSHFERMIRPLLHKRALFAGAEAFRLYDVIGEAGEVVEDVYCYGNRHGGRRALVLFNNSDTPRRGRAHRSAAWRDPALDRLRSETLASALGLDTAGGEVLFLDPRTGARQTTPAAELRDRGLWIDLAPFECRVYLDPTT